MDTHTYLNTDQLAELTGVAASTWRKRRVTGDTPKFLKIGARCVYRLSDVEAWLAERERVATCQA